MIIYIHGLDGNGEENHAKLLRQFLKTKGFIAPTLSIDPKYAIQTLEELIETFLQVERVYLIGASLGGYYATYLAYKYQLPCVLINPIINPKITLEQKINKEYIDMFDMYKVKKVSDYAKLYMLLLQKDDEVVDYEKTCKRFILSKCVVEEKGSHNFENIEQHIDEIDQFFIETSTKLSNLKYYIQEIGLNNFLQNIEPDKLAEVFNYFSKEDQEEMLDSMSKRGKDRFIEELGLICNVSIEEAAIGFKNIEEQIKRIFSEELKEVIEKLDKYELYSEFAKEKECLDELEIESLLEPVQGVLSSIQSQEVLEFATKAHGNQLTPFGYPYIYHCMSVALIVLEATQIENSSQMNEAVKIALLHDTIEDTTITYEDIKKVFGQNTADAVLSLSLNRTLKTKTEQIKDSLQRIKQQPKSVWMVKLADRISNLGEPPIHWTKQKKQNYLDDARTIWSELHEASEFLSKRLNDKIFEYKKYIQEEEK